MKQIHERQRKSYRILRRRAIQSRGDTSSRKEQSHKHPFPVIC